MDISEQQSPIYEAKNKRHLLIRIIENILSLAFTIVLWLFIIITLYNKLYVNTNASLLHTLTIMTLVVIASILLIILWQFYNWLRFHRKKRRKDFPQQPLTEVGRLYGISAENMERLQQIRNVAVVEFRNHRYYYCIAGESPIEIGMLRKQ
jgi:poly-beta-1,6-N-acetyl-D-glucosamine biosynthesis protein PgaD